MKRLKDDLAVVLIFTLTYVGLMSFTRWGKVALGSICIAWVVAVFYVATKRAAK